MRYKILVVVLLLSACAPKPTIKWDELDYAPAADSKKLDTKGWI